MPTRARVLLSQVYVLPAHSVTWFSRVLPHQTRKNQGVSCLGSAAVSNDHVGWALEPLPYCCPTNRSQGPGYSPTHPHANRCFCKRETPVLTTARGHLRRPTGQPFLPPLQAARMPKPRAQSVLQPHLPWSTSPASRRRPLAPTNPRGGWSSPLDSNLPRHLCLKDISGHECYKGPTPSVRLRARVPGTFQATLELQRSDPLSVHGQPGTSPLACPCVPHTESCSPVGLSGHHSKASIEADFSLSPRQVRA